MTAKRRARKFNTTRSNSDDDPYTRRIREASAGAKAARARLRGEGQGESPSRKAAAGVAEGLFEGAAAPGNVEEVTKGIVERRLEGRARGQASRRQAADLFPFVYGKLGREEALRPEAAPDAAPLAERGTAEAPGQPADEQEAGFQEAAPAHREFVEAVVNGLPEHIETKSCTCDAGKDHWTEVGEI